MFDNILWYVKINKCLSFRPKKCKKKTKNTTKYIKMEISFISSKLTKREVEKEKVLLYSCLAEFTL